MWWLEALALAYLGLAALARANHRFHALPLPRERIASAVQARLIGWLLLAVTLWISCRNLGVGHGLVATACVLALAGVPLVLLLSIRPRAALAPVTPLLLPMSAPRHRS